MCVKCSILVATLTILGSGCSRSPSSSRAEPREMDRDLMEVTIPQLEQLYATHKYTVTEVVRWYLARIDKYNGIYRAVQTLNSQGALATDDHEEEKTRTG